MAKRAVAPTHWFWSDYSTARGKRFVTELRGLTDAAHTKLLRGERLRRVPRLTVFETTRGGAFVDILGMYFGCLCVRPILERVVMTTPGVNVQRLPVSVRKERVTYAILNVLDAVPAFDLKGSTYDTYPSGLIRKFTSLVLRRIPATAPAIFHVKESITTIMVSDELKRRLEDASETPGRLMSPEEYCEPY